VKLIICDLSMPVMGGRELFLEMNRRGLDIPFVLLSGYLSREELQEFHYMGISGCLHKPADLGEITSLMRKLLS
jgi:DNA-binding NarL/FixJ family response regulator